MISNRLKAPLWCLMLAAVTPLVSWAQMSLTAFENSRDRERGVSLLASRELRSNFGVQVEAAPAVP